MAAVGYDWTMIPQPGNGDMSLSTNPRSDARHGDAHLMHHRALRCRVWVMRTTVTIDDDIRKAIEALRRERGLSTSAALNELARRGLAASAADTTEPFRQRTSPMGRPRYAVENIGDVLEVLEGPDHR